MGKQRIKWIDSLKGFTIILVVLGHIADGYLSASIYNEYRDILLLIYNIIYSFHMPLFFVISGYVFFLAYCKDSNILDRNEGGGERIKQIGIIYYIKY